MNDEPSPEIITLLAQHISDKLNIPFARARSIAILSDARLQWPKEYQYWETRVPLGALVPDHIPNKVPFISFYSNFYRCVCSDPLLCCEGWRGAQGQTFSPQEKHDVEVNGRYRALKGRCMKDPLVEKHNDGRKTIYDVVFVRQVDNQSVSSNFVVLLRQTKGTPNFSFELNNAQ